MEIPSENCVRKMVKIQDENFYLIIGKNFVQATVPRENAPDQSKIRGIVETLCEVISEVQGERF